ncbi:MAG: 1,4-dihydroxy-2-naphthoate octaprenyltransferase [Paludibacteraceae bacterium]|nr:1,4-dihydroxy-2-naphthoate octaprenyltransferase [Paludibacteraceae bacterium]
MNKYIASLRLRTLPLSMSGIILGAGLAWPIDWYVFAWSILTTLSLQILTNLSNELGDAQRGTDSDQEGRAALGLQTGAITEQQMRTMIILFIFLSMVFGGALILTAFDTFLCVPAAVFLGLGALAIVGAMTYTLGKHNYGYKGFGDLGVFLFFGLLSTMGSYYLQAKTMTVEVVLAAVAIAMPIVGVLNLNNIRDMDNDLKHGKLTFASRLGKTGGKIYQTLMLAVCYGLFVYLGRYWVLCTLPIIIWHVWYIFRHEGSKLDLQMPVLMFTTIIIAILAVL